MGVITRHCVRCGREIYFWRETVERLKHPLCLPCARPDLFQWVDDQIEAVKP